MDVLELLEEMMAETAQVSTDVLNSESPWQTLAVHTSIRSALEQGVIYRLAVLAEIKDRFVTTRLKEMENCEHDWVDIRNSLVESGEMCSKCGRVRAGNDDR